MKEKLDSIKIQIEIIKMKLLTFIGLTGAGWGYLISHNLDFSFLSFIIILFITIGAIASANNLTKLSNLYQEVEEIKNGK